MQAFTAAVCHAQRSGNACASHASISAHRLPCGPVRTVLVIEQPILSLAEAPAAAPEAAQQSTVVAEPTAATVPSPVALTPLPTPPPGQLTAPVGLKNESLVPALWALDRCVRTVRVLVSHAMTPPGPCLWSMRTLQLVLCPTCSIATHGFISLYRDLAEPLQARLRQTVEHSSDHEYLCWIYTLITASHNLRMCV